MCAFIQAHPYDVPTIVPPIFEHLSVHLNDTEPIPVSNETNIIFSNDLHALINIDV